MQKCAAVAISVASWISVPGAQEVRPVPRDSTRVVVPGCSRGVLLTAGPRTLDEPGSMNIPEGMRLRMNAPKKVMAEIKAHEGSMIEVTGLIKKGQREPDGINLGGGVRIGPGQASPGGGGLGSPTANQVFIDVEGWRPLGGNCPSR
jgi:hypothetical protein